MSRRFGRKRSRVELGMARPNEAVMIALRWGDETKDDGGYLLCKLVCVRPPKLSRTIQLENSSGERGISTISTHLDDARVFKGAVFIQHEL